MDRRTFLTIAWRRPSFGQAAKPVARTDCPRRAVDPMGRSSSQFSDGGHGLKDTWPADRTAGRSGSGRSARAISSTAVENGVLYTMYGKPREEVVLAANAETGETLWEHVHPDDVPE